MKGSWVNWTAGAVLCSCIVAGPCADAAEAKTPTCAGDNGGLKLPAGFCASIFADGIGHARHMAVAPNGVVYVNTWSGGYYGHDRVHVGGFLVALQDTKGSGIADVSERFGETMQSGGAGGTGIGLYKSWLYAEINDKIVRYALSSDSIVPTGQSEVIVSGLPLGGDHPMHPFIIDTDGQLYIDVATATNACQRRNRSAGSPGENPCTELKTRGGVWRYDANRLGQMFSPNERYATGIRNAEGFGLDTAGHRLFITQHGRDQLHANWPNLYKPEEEATLPAEELMRLVQGGDYGWPECYYDPMQKKLVLAPEYGGDGGKNEGVCAQKLGPVAAFPAHWAPNGMVFYDAQSFPARYRGGVFIAFHGSWDRAPYPQQGYNVVFQSLSGDNTGGRCEVFADGFAGARKEPGIAEHRPSGVAVGPDGALYVSDDVHGRIYRIVYRGGAEQSTAAGTACPSDAVTGGPMSDSNARPPEGTHADAAGPAPASLPLAPGATRDRVVLGARVFHGEVGGAACTGCHGSDGAGTTLGPDLTDKQWLWGDGSLKDITATITQGVPNPKQYRAPMPAMGGAELTPEQVAAVSAYVWGLSHR